MSVIEAASGTYRSRVDGTIVLSVEISPIHRAAALALFGMPGTPMALAALKVGHAIPQEQEQEPEPELEPSPPKGGALAKLAGQWSNEESFYVWMRGREWPVTWNAGTTMRETAANGIRAICGVKSRADIDHDDTATERFHRLIRLPYQAHLKTKVAQPA